jgi:hypothetical protein
MKTIVILLTTIVASIFNSSETTVEYYQNCTAELSVHKDRSFKSAAEDGASFKLTLTNTSSKAATYILSTTNLSEPCDNKGGRASTGSNVNLNVSIQSNTLRAIPSNEITLKGGESYSFIVKVTVPNGTKTNSWSCINVEAQSKGCLTKAIKTLSVFVPEPSEG